MLRETGAALATAALVVGVLAAPAAAVEPATPADAVLPAPVRPDTDGDGVEMTTTAAELGPQERSLVIPVGGEAEVADSSSAATIDLAGSPEMVALEDVPIGATLAIRSSSAAGWSPWTELHADGGEAPDDAPASRTTDIGPIWIGTGATALEVALVDGETRAPVSDVGVTGLHLSDLDAPGPSGIRALASTSAAAAGTGFVRPRSSWATTAMGWATYNSGCGTGPSTAKELKAFIVHHSAGTNDYTAAQVPGIIRGIWSYHVNSQKWCDIAYNFVVDKFGGIWEGRQGGTTKAIIGGHTRGYNTGSTGAVQLGNYQTAGTTTALNTATTRLIGWKLGLHGIDPTTTTTLNDRTIRRVVGHRDLGTTSCPGESTYSRLSSFRTGARPRAHLHPLHRAFLRRSLTEADYVRWLPVVEQSGVGAAATGMARSAEYSGLIIDDLYRRVLGREPDAEGRRYWLDQLASGVRIEQVGIYFYGSDEYYSRTGGPEGFVHALYENLLHREPDDDGYRYWVDKLRAGTAAPPDAATGFYMSVESRRDRVTRLYQRFLGRNPDAGGLDYWAERLIRTDDIMLAVELSVSEEFVRRNLA